jgi:hypothetical protein
MEGPHMNGIYCTCSLSDGREIESSVQIAGDRTRLRARLVKDGAVTESFRRDFSYNESNFHQEVRRAVQELEANTPLEQRLRPFLPAFYRYIF